MRFSIRDLLWATALVAIGLAWWGSHRALDDKRLEAVGQAHRLHRALADAKQWHTYLPLTSPRPATPDWTALDEPLIEP
jgi:hypothetical protein